ncbi:MAG: ABC transporter ATP-binding protein [Elusimicrobiota bacterium]
MKKEIFKNILKDLATLGQLAPYLRPLRNDFVVAALSMGVVAAISSASMGLIKFLVDQIFIDNDRQMLVDLTWIVPVLFLFKSIFSYLLNYLMSKIGHAVARSIRSELVEKILLQDHEFHSKIMGADLLARATNDVAAVLNMISNVPLFVMRDGMTVIFLLGLIFYLNAKFALAIFAAIPIFVVLFIGFNASLRRVTTRAQNLVGQIYSSIAEALGGLSIIKIYLYERPWIERFNRQNEDHYKAMVKFQRLGAMSPSLMEFLSGIVMTLVLFWGGSEVIRGSWSAGDFMAFLGAAFASYQPIKHLAQVNSIVQMGIAGWNRIAEIKDAPLVISSAVNSRSTDALDFHKDIELRDVGFVYPDGRRALKSINLKINKGEILGIAGPSGSGKSTLVNLLVRFYDPAAGTILIDGQDISYWDTAKLRRLFAFVTQESFLFNDTIAANIAVGRPSATLAEIEAAAKAANAMEFIERLPEGLRTMAGERGLSFSAGQRQRLGIARAVLKNPQILILDEATSNLDPESEDYVLSALVNLLKNKTAIVISHRAKTLESADRIIVVENGEIVEEIRPRSSRLTVLR